MRVSLEALAMAGIDSNEWAMDAEEWKTNTHQMENDDIIPPHLLADEDEENIAAKELCISGHRKDDGLVVFCAFRRSYAILRKMMEKRAS
uniref:Uncharacterized protein n=3 Tax=Cucumis sativus TaxID=3659 RepID=A0A0A0KU90_CUCSA